MLWEEVKNTGSLGNIISSTAKHLAQIAVHEARDVTRNLLSKAEALYICSMAPTTTSVIDLTNCYCEEEYVLPAGKLIDLHPCWYAPSLVSLHNLQQCKWKYTVSNLKLRSISCFYLVSALFNAVPSIHIPFLSDDEKKNCGWVGDLINWKCADKLIIKICDGNIFRPNFSCVVFLSWVNMKWIEN